MIAPLNVSSERMNFSLRLKETLHSARGLPASPTVLAREFNFRYSGEPVTVHAARKWLVGDALPTQDKLRTLATWLGVSVEWLRFGGAQNTVGLMGDSRQQEIAVPLYSLVRLFQTLPQRDRMLARAFIEMLATKIKVPAGSAGSDVVRTDSAEVIGSI